MKKLFIAVIMTMLSINVFAQLQETRPSYQTIYEWGGFGVRHGEIRYDGNIYYLCGESSNRFESKMHTIVLGTTKETAIVSINQLDSLSDNMGRKDEVKVIGIGDKQTTLFKEMGTLCFTTQYVAGWTDCLYALKPQKAIKAIEEFVEK